MITPKTSVEDAVAFFRLPPQSDMPDGWLGWDNTRQAHIQLLEESVLNAGAYDETLYSGRGIVTCVSAKSGMSSGKYLAQGHVPGFYCQLQELRRLGCTLPVYLAYLGEEELDSDLAELLKPLGVTCVDLMSPDLPVKMRVCNGWESKICAILNSPFEEVLFLDSDNIPVTDPTFLFDTIQYKTHHAILWPDLPPQDRPSWLPKEVWDNVGLPHNPDAIDAESGQLLLNKRHWHEQLQAIKCLNEHSEYTYKWVYGDKSTYLLGGEKVTAMRGCRSHAMTRHGCDWAGKSILQKDFDGRVVFNHCVQNKPTLKGFPFPQYLVNREYLEGHLKELSALWDGQLWAQRTVNEEESLHTQELISTPWLYSERQLRFLRNGCVGKGLTRKETTYGVFCRSNKPPKLIIKGVEGEVNVSLIKQEDGSWAGVNVKTRELLKLIKEVS